MDFCNIFLNDIKVKNILDSFTDPILIIDNNFKISLANEAMLRYLSVSYDVLSCQDMEEFVFGLHKNDAQWDEISNNKQGMVREAILIAPQKRIDVMVTISPLMIDAQSEGFILLFRDMRSVKELMDSLKSAYQNMSSLVVRDALTGLYNRGHFNQRVKDFYYSATRNKDKSFSFIMFDIDHFKDINDNLGHQVGDEVIIKISSLAQEFFSQHKSEVFRYGGEEFVAISSNITAETLFLFADQYRQIIEDAEFPQQIKVTISLGAIFYSEKFKSELPSVDVLIRRADAALYKAKESGRNQVQVVETTIQEETGKENFDVDLF